MAGLLVGLLAGCATRPSPPSVRGIVEHTTEADVGVDASELLLPIVERSGVPGMVAVVLRGDSIVAHAAVGVRRRGSPTPVTLQDSFELASATKAMTATVAARLVESGRVHWDTRIGETFGGEEPGIDPRWRDVTLRQLLAQCAGLEDHRLLFLRIAGRGGSVESQRAAYTAQVLRQPPAYTPGTQGIYSNTNYLVAAALLERVAGRSWEELMREEVFQPLGLATGGFGPPGAGRTLDEPWGHGGYRFLHLPVPGPGNVPHAPSDTYADYPRYAAPAGMAHLSVLDWARFVGVHLRGDTDNPRREDLPFLRAETFGELHRAEPVGFRETPSAKAPIPDTGYALGWFVGHRGWARGDRPTDTGRVLYHVGENGRWTCAVWVAPELDFAILVACNRGHSWGPVDQATVALLARFKPTEH